MTGWFEPDGAGLRVRVRVKPRARKSQVLGPKQDALEVAVAAVPADGAANEELCATLARHFDVPKSSIEITSGHGSRTKLLRFRVRPATLT